MTQTSCERCGFLAADYSDRDLATAPSWLDAMTRTMVEGAGPALTSAPVAATMEELSALISTMPAERDGGPGAGAVHHAVHLLRDLGRQLHDAGAGAPNQEGMVFALSISDGGVPKSAVPSADIGFRGLLGDRQGNRRHHGRPFQAVCIWSADVIDALRSEGHPIHSGQAGENVTVEGIDWSTIRPGVRLQIGQVLCEVSAWATPCRHNDQWFTGRSDRIDHDLHPGWSRAYAWVLEPGSVEVGDPVIVEP